jgi:hypothetical protein
MADLSNVLSQQVEYYDETYFHFFSSDERSSFSKSQLVELFALVLNRFNKLFGGVKWCPKIGGFN